MDFPQLTNNIQQTHDLLQNNAVRAVNQNITARNWLVGYWIVEFEQNGEDRAKYGERLLSELAKAIHIKGMGATMLSQCRRFYMIYPQIGIEVELFLRKPQNLPIFQTLTEKLQIAENYNDTIFQTLSEKSADEKIYQINEVVIPRVGSDKIFKSLSFSHLIELLSIDNPLKRSFYEIETIKGCWSVRELRRQIDTLCYERAGISKNPEKLMALVNDKAEVATSTSIVKSPYVFDFLGLKSADVVEESDLETLLISHIQEFILELGEGFCFEGRQKRILIDEEYFHIDLVFYNRLLRCFVLIDLKRGKLKAPRHRTNANVRQLLRQGGEVG
mgnify:CR=1 FL=1